MFEKYNRQQPKFTYNSTSNEFVSLKKYAEDHGREIIVRGVFTFEGKKGVRACVVTDGFNIYLPDFMIEDVTLIRATPEEVEAINQGKCGFTIYTYEDKKHGNGICYSGSFHDIK